MNCQHQFVKIADVDKVPPTANGIPARPIPGAEAACCICGEVRRVWSDGTVDIKIEGKYGKPLRHDIPNPDTDQRAAG